MSSSIILSHLQRRMSGWIPISWSFFTDCCVGFVFSSPPIIVGTSVRWTVMQLCFPISWESCRATSRNGIDSMSPTVPPISTMTTSAPVLEPVATILRFISSVMWGIT